MAEIGRSKGADPSQWYATFSPMSINNLDIEVYENGKWLKLKKENGEFDSELFNRNLEKTFVYKKGKEMEEKMMKEVESQNLNQDNIKKQVIEENPKEIVEDKVEEVIEDKVEEVIEEKVEEVIEEKAEEELEEKAKEVVEEKAEEKTQSKGIFSKIKNLFKR